MLNNRFDPLPKYPDNLEHVDQQGKITTGQFENGQFVALKQT